VSDKDGRGFAEKIADKLGELFALQEERTRTQIAAGLVETRNALRLRGARSVPVAGSQLVNGGPGRLTGWSLRAAAGAPADVTFRDSRDAFGDPVAVVTIPAGATSNHALPGVSVTEALYIDVTAGAVSGSVHLGAVD
jgi:hypothetical protein